MHERRLVYSCYEFDNSYKYYHYACGYKKLISSYERVAILFDKETGTLLRHGSYDYCLKEKESFTEALRFCGDDEIYVNLKLILLPSHFPVSDLNLIISETSSVIPILKKHFLSLTKASKE